MIKRRLKIIKTFQAIKILLLVSSILSCAMSSGAYKDIDHAIDSDNFSEAVDVIVKRQKSNKVIYSQKNAIMLFLDKGMLEHYAGNYAASSADLQNAERLIEEAYTKSISEGFLSYIVNDNVKEYPGEDFENIYINVFNALNYYNRNNIEGALVEIRKLSNTNGKLDMLSRKYDYKDPKTGSSLNDMVNNETGISGLPDAKSVNFSNSALARYLGALFYQADGNMDSARIEFNQVYRAYSTQKNIYSGDVPKAVADARDLPAGKARLNIISFTGLSPVKEEQTVIQYLPFQHPILQIATFKLPEMVKRPSQINRIEVEINGSKRFDLELLENMGDVIQETFNAHYSNMLIKTYIRTIIKYVVADVAAMAAENQNDSLAGFLVAVAARLAMDASERADTRMSRYLPDRAYIGGINIDPGTYSVIIKYCNGNKAVYSEEFSKVTVKSGRLNLLQSVKLK
ncbi:COG3014 family protein [Treponema sp. R80B11-R83G3]